MRQLQFDFNRYFIVFGQRNDYLLIKTKLCVLKLLFFAHTCRAFPPSPPDFLIVDVFSKQLISPVRWGADTADTQLHVTLSQQRPKTLFAGYSERFALTWRYSGRHIYLYLFFIVLSAIFSIVSPGVLRGSAALAGRVR